MGQQGSFPNSIGVNMEQHGQRALCSNVSKLMGVMGTQTIAQPPNTQYVVSSTTMLIGEEFIIIGLSKKIMLIYITRHERK